MDVDMYEHEPTISQNHEAAMFRNTAAQAAYDREQTLSRPSYIFRPRLFIDGDRWCALYGENLQDGVAGFGASPEAAYADFDRAWTAELPKQEARDE